MYLQSQLSLQETLQKENPDSWKEPSDLRCSCTTNACWKNVPNFGVVFIDAYHTYVCSLITDIPQFQQHMWVVQVKTVPYVFENNFFVASETKEYKWLSSPVNVQLRIYNQCTKTESHTHLN